MKRFAVIYPEETLEVTLEELRPHGYISEVLARTMDRMEIGEQYKLGDLTITRVE